MNSRRIKKADINDLILNQTDFMTEELNELLATQVIKELSNSYLYFAMATKCATASYNGFSNFFNEKAKEEYQHACMIRDILVDVNKKVKFYSIPEIQFIGSDLIEIFKQFLNAEKQTTADWIAIKEAMNRDNAFGASCLGQFVDMFLNEQISEEKEAKDLLTIITKARGDASAILSIENRLMTEASKLLN